MAIAMSFVMSLVQTIARLGFAPSLASAWLTSFAIGVTVAIPPRSWSPRTLSDWPAISPAGRAARRRTSASKQPSRSPIAAVAVARRVRRHNVVMTGSTILVGLVVIGPLWSGDAVPTVAESRKAVVIPLPKGEVAM